MKRLIVTIGLLWLSGLYPAGAVGFQFATAPDPDQEPLQVAIWYPSAGATSYHVIEAFDMNVAIDGAISSGRHALIVMSHGSGGMALNSYDTAMALAAAGFVVAAVTHTGDNYRDQSSAFTRKDFVDRPRHISRVIDFMLNTWPGHQAIDPGRIGMWGHSAGGTTALIDAGGIADLGRVMAYCRTHANDWGCQRAREHNPAAPETVSEPIKAPDPRVKAIVLAAPALAAAFQPGGLAAVRVPVQLWTGGKDEIVPDAPLITALLPRPPDYHPVPQAGHFAYLSPCSELLSRSAPQICADPSGFKRVAFLRAFHRSIIAFYRERLK